MSLVGPRPPLPSEVARYERWQLRRLSVPPGLTCIWQVTGRNEIGFDEWIELGLSGIELTGGASFATQELAGNDLNTGAGFEALLHYRVLPHTGLRSAIRMAATMRTEIEALAIRHDGSEISNFVTCSFGVASTESLTDDEDLFEAADRQLYRAKQSGRLL